MTTNNGYDLVVPSLAEMQQELQAGLFRPLTKSEIPNLKYLDPTLQAKIAKVDPNNNYGIVYSWGTIGIGYNVDMIHKILGPNVNPDDWKYVLDPKYLSKLQQCGVAYIDMPYHVYGITLFYLGLNPNSNRLSDYITATNYLMNIRKYLTYFSNSNYIYDLASGNLCIVMGYSGDVMHAVHFANEVNKGIHIKYVIPKSGAPIWFDMLAIPKNAPHPDATMAFINYLLEPKIAAEQSNFLYQPNPIPASKPYLIPILQDPNVTPTPAIMAKLFEIRIPSGQLSTDMNTMWLQVRYGLKENK